MTLRWLLAALHLLPLGIGLGAVWARSRALRPPMSADALRRALAADSWWAVAAVLWLVTGLWRWLGGLEKPTGYYLQNHVFWGKMTLFVAIVLLEIRPAVTLAGWRRRVAQGEAPDLRAAPTLARISGVQAGLLVLMVLAATAMARGYGLVGD